MASITIRNLDGEVKSRLRLRAALNNRSMEEEARQILAEAVRVELQQPTNLATFTRDCFASVGFVEIELPERGSMREPPKFS